MFRTLLCVLMSVLCIGCFSSSEMSPRYLNPMTRDVIQTERNFAGVHLHNVPPGWSYLSEHGAGYGDMAVVVNRSYDAIFWLSTNPLHDDPATGVAEIRRLRSETYLDGEWLMDQEILADSASVTYSVDRDHDGQLVEVQKTAYRRLQGKYGKTLTMTLHGRWPLTAHSKVHPVFDALVASATLE